jgi:hypothetical protein
MNAGRKQSAFAAAFSRQTETSLPAQNQAGITYAATRLPPTLHNLYWERTARMSSRPAVGTYCAAAAPAD